MQWRELIAEVSSRSGVSHKETRRVLETFVAVTTERLVDGDSVVLRQLGTLRCVLRRATTTRSISDGRKMFIGERNQVRFATSSVLKRAVSSPEAHWRDPDHQAAWRVAETLVGDLLLYHGDTKPSTITKDTSLDETQAICARAFGDHWSRLVDSYNGRVSSEIRQGTQYLSMAAQRRLERTP